MRDFYREEYEMPEVTVDKLYRLRIEINKAERHTSFAERRNNLEKLSSATEHSGCKSFLLNALAAILHERRRSFVFIRRFFDLQWDEESYSRYYACVTHPDDQAVFEKMNKYCHLNIG